MRITHRNFKLLCIGTLVAVLGACSSSPMLEHANNGWIVTLKATMQDTAAKLEQEYGGQTIAFEPEAEFAILHMQKLPPLHDARVTSVQEEDTTSLPEVQKTSSTSTLQTQGTGAWSGGSSVWSSGITSWGSGWTIWGSGNTDATTSTPPEANRAVWDQIRLDEAQPYLKKFGAGIKIAVIDTGIDLEHPIFTGRLAPHSEWRDFVDSDRIPQDEAGGNGYGHGTAVAGLIAQVAPRATILPIRVLGSNGAGRTASVIAAIAEAVRSGAQIINVSVGTDGWDQALFAVCKLARKRGVYVIASVGNNGLRDGVTSPALFSSSPETRGWVFGVGSEDATGQRSSFSAFGRGLSILAPGEGLSSSYPEARVTRATGTSFAAPLVSGALALMVSEGQDSGARAVKEFDIVPVEHLEVTRLLAHLPASKP